MSGLPGAPAVDAPPAAPAAPVEAPAPVAAAPAPPAAPEAPAAANALPTDVPALHAMIADLRKENGADRTNAKAQAAEAAKKELAQTIGKALGLVEDDAPLDPAVLTASLTTSQADAKQARVELAVFRNAGAVGGDPAVLLDSTSFLKSLEAIDPTDEAAVTAAITAAVTANPRLGAASAPETRVPAPVPGQGAGGSGLPGLDAQIAEAEKAGDIQKSIALKQQRAAELRKA